MTATFLRPSRRRFSAISCALDQKAAEIAQVRTCNTRPSDRTPWQGECRSQDLSTTQPTEQHVPQFCAPRQVKSRRTSARGYITRQGSRPRRSAKNAGGERPTAPAASSRPRSRPFSCSSPIGGLRESRPSRQDRIIPDGPLTRVPNRDSGRPRPFDCRRNDVASPTRGHHCP
jgi:hypothetical protein